MVDGAVEVIGLIPGGEARIEAQPDPVERCAQQPEAP
jgi:hypothetical protein